ncbi:MAG: hypothetical protein AAF763_02840 [Pseudomonadota bacterium]
MTLPLEFFVPLLAFGTLAAWLVFAVIGARRVKRMREDDDREPSSLAADG